MLLKSVHKVWMQCGEAFRRLMAGAKRGPMSLSWLSLALSLVPSDVQAEPIETEHLFAFTIGSDVGDVGDREIEGSATSRFSKRTGTYDANSGTLSAEFVPLPNLRTEFTGVIDAYNISGVYGFADRHETAFGGLSVDIRYRLLDRSSAPFGLAIGAEPHWDRVDDLTGERVSQYGADLVAAADFEIVRDRIVAAVNLIYQPYSTRFNLTGIWSQEATAGVAGALMAQIRPGILIGGEARYLRQYDGLGFDNLAGQGFFVGPTAYFKLTDQAWLTVAWSTQVAGHATAVAGSLDLVNFERQQVRVLFGVNF
jgi:hypothetical protein